MITDLGVLEPDPHSCELTLTQVHVGVQLQHDPARSWLEELDRPWPAVLDRIAESVQTAHARVAAAPIGRPT